jgi:hypothetical protein
MYHHIPTGIPAAVIVTYGATHSHLALGTVLAMLGVLGLMLSLRATRHERRSFH